MDDLQELKINAATDSSWAGGVPPFGMGSKKLGMWLFIVSDTLTFSALLLTYSYSRITNPDWPRPFPINPAIIYSTIMTVVLLFSSLTMVMAVSASHRGERKKTVWWMLATMVGGLTFTALHLREWLHLIDGWIGHRIALGRKGLIHAVSYRRMKFIVDNSEHAWCMMMHNSHDRAKIVEEFRQADGPRVLVSPSIDTGYDFAHMQARFQVIAKLPFASVQDPVVRARQDKDKDYGLYQVAQTLVQATGRIMRADDDWGETLIADQSVEWAIPRMKAKGFLPLWWVKSFQSLDELPLPIEFTEEK